MKKVKIIYNNFYMPRLAIEEIIECDEWFAHSSGGFGFRGSNIEGIIFIGSNAVRKIFEVK